MIEVKLRNGEIINLKILGINYIKRLCDMIQSLDDEGRSHYRYLVIDNYKSFIKCYLRILGRLLLNLLIYKMFGRYFLGVIAVNGCKEVVGFVHLDIALFDSFKHAQYGIVVRGDYRGRGIGEVLTRHIIGYAKAFGVNTIYLTVDTDNEAAIRLYKKFGFVIEALLRRVDSRGGKICDIYYMALHLSQ